MVAKRGGCVLDEEEYQLMMREIACKGTLAHAMRLSFKISYKDRIIYQNLMAQ